MKATWEKAQKLEQAWHLKHPGSIEHYRRVYINYFKFLGIDYKGLGSKIILEIGPGMYPALMYCSNYNGILIEPNHYVELDINVYSKPINVVRKPAEDFNFGEVDEVWLLNVLQHVIDPELIIKKAKEAAQIIRFFEPINTPVNDTHLHSFTMDSFLKWFGNYVNYYPPHPESTDFHKHECAYGIWERREDV